MTEASDESLHNPRLKLHRCEVCQDGHRQPVDESKRCRVVAMFERAEKQCETELKKLRCWEGRDWFRSLLADYWRVISMLGTNDGAVSDKWPQRIVTMATVIADTKYITEQRCASEREQFERLKAGGFS